MHQRNQKLPNAPSVFDDCNPTYSSPSLARLLCDDCGAEEVGELGDGVEAEPNGIRQADHPTTPTIRALRSALDKSGGTAAGAGACGSHLRIVVATAA